MTSREIVERAITFQNPPRIPLKFDIVGVNDCYDVWTVDATGWTWGFEGEATDEWGCLWKRTGVANTGQPVVHPLADLGRLTQHQWPDPDAPARYAGFEQQLFGAGDRFVMFCFGQGIFERLHMLTGMSQALTAFLKHKDEVHEILDRVLDFHLRVFRNCVKIADGLNRKMGTSGPRMHAAAMADDWGKQDRAFVPVKIFREFFKPRYQKWFDEIKAAGLHTWMHSCGRINDVVEELIDVGLEVINNQQPNTVGIEEFGQRYRGRICFEAIVDTQSTLPRGTYTEIRQQARELARCYGTPQGGFIASDYNDAAAIGVTDDRRLVMFEAFAQAGGYAGYRDILERYSRPRTGHSWGMKTSEK
jgi:uroporphyrinogen decarboxylase